MVTENFRRFKMFDLARWTLIDFANRRVTRNDSAGSSVDIVQSYKLSRSVSINRKSINASFRWKLKNLDVGSSQTICDFYHVDVRWARWNLFNQYIKDISHETWMAARWTINSMAGGVAQASTINNQCFHWMGCSNSAKIVYLKVENFCLHISAS